MIEKIAHKSEKFFKNFLPDTFVLLLLITILAFALADWKTSLSRVELLEIWSDGFWSNIHTALSLSLSIALIETLFSSKFFRILIYKLSNFPKSNQEAIFMISSLAIFLGWFHWKSALIFSALLVKEVAKKLHSNSIHYHYPLLVASAYMAILTPHLLIKESIFISIALLFFTPILLTQFVPKRFNLTLIDFHIDLRSNLMPINTKEKPVTFAEKLDHSYITNFCVGILILSLLFFKKAEDHFKLNDFNFNFLILGFSLLLHRNPISFFNAFLKSAKGYASLSLQILFYGGILFLFQKSNFMNLISNFILKNTSTKFLTLKIFILEIFNKFFYPIEPNRLIDFNWNDKVQNDLLFSKMILIAKSYAQSLGNLIQPFWCIPLARITQIKCRDIMGFAFTVFIFIFPILAIALWTT
jgi:short-chain fatty acids transporter